MSTAVQDATEWRDIWRGMAESRRNDGDEAGARSAEYMAAQHERKIPRSVTVRHRPAHRTLRVGETRRPIGQELTATAPNPPAPPVKPPIRPSADTGRPVSRSPDTCSAADLMPMNFARPTTPAAAAPAQAETEPGRKLPVHIANDPAMLVRMAGISNGDGKGGVNATVNPIAAPAPVRSATPAGMVGVFEFSQRLGWNSSPFERAISAGWIPQPARVEASSRFWREADVVAAVAKFRK